MQFFEKNNALEHEFIISLFPYLSDVLAEYTDLDVSFEVDQRRIKLHSDHSNPIYTNIDSELDYHKKFFFKNSIYKQPLAKALGLKKGVKHPHVWDVSAGMLSDSILMYSFGCKVSALERNPVAYILSVNALIESGLNINLFFMDAIDFNKSVDVIYFDPMYAEKNNKALPKKEMRIFRDIVGVDTDAKDVAKNLKLQCRRLVLKRSIKALPLIESPSMSIKGKSTAYDVYFNLSM